MTSFSLKDKSSICGVCNRKINKNNLFITCSLCNDKIHCRCNTFDYETYKQLITIPNSQIFCINCKEDNIPFQKLHEHQFQVICETGVCKDSEHLNISIANNYLKKYFDDINNLSISSSDDDFLLANLNCKYYDIPSFVKFKKHNKQLSIFHLNIASLHKHKDELETLFEMLECNFDFVGLTETKIKEKTPTFNIDLHGYKPPFSTPTDADKGGAILYIKNHFVTNRRTDLEIFLYKSKELESVFVEICNNNQRNIVVGCIYRHPNMDLKLFNTQYFHPLLSKLDYESKRIFFVGDFNIDLMKVDHNPETTTFFDRLTSSLLVPHIIHPTRYTSHSKTLIDNIFSNSTNFLEDISGNLTVAISDYLPQFLFMDYEASPQKKNIN